MISMSSLSPICRLHCVHKFSNNNLFSRKCEFEPKQSLICTKYGLNNTTWSLTLDTKKGKVAKVATKEIDHEVQRPIANFDPCIWGDTFLNYSPSLHQATNARYEEEAKELEVHVRNKFAVLLTEASEKPLELLRFVDNVECLGVTRHFQEQIEEALQRIFNFYSTLQNITSHDQLDLHHTSLAFRILRQHGFRVPSEVFKVLKDEKGNFKEQLASDVRGMLSLYEASQLRVNGENILEEALEFTTFHLKSLQTSGQITHPLSLLVTNSLHIPIHKAMPRYLARKYISFYDQDPTHDKTLLKFAKLDFNLVQSLYKEELMHLSRWWKGLDLASKLPFPTRSRVVEGYFWTTGVVYEPKNSLSRHIMLKIFKLLTLVDDMYDAYASIEEIESFYKALQRWDISCVDELPPFMQVLFCAILDTFKEFEGYLMKEGRSHLVQYAIKETIEFCGAGLQEIRWRESKHTPTYNEYLEEASIISFANKWSNSVFLLGILEATEEDFKWVRRNPHVIHASGKFGRLLNDMVSREFERKRWHIPSSVECYMKENGTTVEETHKVFYEELEGVVKDVNEAMLKPTVLSKVLLDVQLNLNRMLYILYDREDGYTFPEKIMIDPITSVLIDPIPI